MQQLKNCLSKQQKAFHGYKDPELVTKLCFKISEAIAEKGKPYSGEFIKNCLEIFIKNASLEKKSFVEQISLSRFTVACQIEDLLENIKVSVKKRISKCSALSIAIDEYRLERYCSASCFHTKSDR